MKRERRPAGVEGRATGGYLAADPDTTTSPPTASNPTVRSPSTWRRSRAAPRIALGVCLLLDRPCRAAQSIRWVFWHLAGRVSV